MERFLNLKRCPWCNTATPTLELKQHLPETRTRLATRVYQCSRCHKCVMADHELLPDGKTLSTPNHVFPNANSSLDEVIPERARNYLEQAQDTIQAPDASIMVSASALDIMLQSIGRRKSEGNLSARIKKAADAHQITQGMADWAHQVRLLANDSRHPDENDDPATTEEAQQSLEFLMALAEFLFVLPARVNEGIKRTKAEADQKQK